MLWSNPSGGYPTAGAIYAVTATPIILFYSEPQLTSLKMNCMWNSQLVTVKDNQLLLRVLRQDNHEWSLSPITGGSLAITDCLCMSVVLDTTLGLTGLFLLTRLDTHKYQLLECNLTEACLANRCTFDWEQSVLSVQLLDGPLLLLASNCELTMLDCNTGQKHNIAVTELVKEGGHTIKAVWAFTLRETASILVFLQLVRDVEEAHCAVFRLDGGNWVFEGQECVPYEYGSIATSIECTERLSMTGEGQLVMHRRFCVGTGYGQVVVFEAGALLYCVTINAAPLKIVVLEVCYLYTLTWHNLS